MQPRAGAPDSKWKRRNLCRLALALTDIHSATQTCDLMLSEKPEIGSAHYWAYHTAIINGYGRPFTENKPLGRLSGVEKILTPAERELHDQILRDRKTSSAHSDLAAKPVYFVPRGAKLGDTGLVSEGGGFSISRTAWPLDRWADVNVLTHRVGEHVQAHAFQLVSEIYGDLYWPEPFPISID